MSLEIFITDSCQYSIDATASPRQNEFVGYHEAFYRVDTVYNANIIGAYEFSITKLQKLLDDIVDYNSNHNLADTDAEITSVRAWKAVSDYDEDHKCVDDLVLSPVRSDGNDAHAYAEEIKIHPTNPAKGLLKMLTGARPCPNLCDPRSYFHTTDAPPSGNPPANANPYKDCEIETVNIEEKELSFNPNTFIR